MPSAAQTEQSWRPLCSIDAALRKAAMMRRSRAFFEQRNILEVDTPLLTRYAVSDPAIDSIEVALKLRSGASTFLQTSPEHCMKRLLSAGFPDIYQICKVFRDTEIGRHHQPEFTMIEWYRLGFALTDMMQETTELITCLVDRRQFGDTPLYMSYADAFADFAGVDPFDADIAALMQAADADDQLRKAIGGRRDDWLDLILAEKVCRGFPENRLTVLFHYPASQAAMARLCPEDPSRADRFEVFAGALELANGYVELADPVEQMHRFDADLVARTEGRHQSPIDASLIAALEAGLPNCAGVAVGFDRVHLLNEGAEDIRQVLCFAFESQVNDA